MERLTIPDEKIEGGWKRAVVDSREVKKHAMPLYWALKKYEDTGLTPEKVTALNERDTAKAMEVEAGKIIKFHRCPVCKEYVHETDCFCFSCGQRLKWED